MKKSEKVSSILGLCGAILVVAGLYFLFFAQGEPTPIGPVMNLHDSIVGMTFMICGTILIAAQWRPR